MKRIASVFILISILLLLAWGVVHGFRVRAVTEETGVVPSEEPSDALHITSEQQQSLGLVCERLKSVSLKPQVRAFGHVLDPSLLVILDSELSAAENALVNSRSESERAESLYQEGENIARKNVETALAQFRADTIKTDALIQRFALEWGGDIAGLDAAARKLLMASLVSGKVALARVELPGGETLDVIPDAAKVLVLGRENQPLVASHISHANNVDPKTQAQGFLLRIEYPSFPLRPGMALAALLSLPGKEMNGVLIPRSAVVRHEGKTWIFVRHGAESFKRREVVLDNPSEDGWLCQEGVMAEDEVVITGAQSLLSSEVFDTGGGEED